MSDGEGQSVITEDPEAEFWRVVSAYPALVHAELNARWERWELDVSKAEVHEVIGGLMARQVTLASQLAGAPSIWNGHVAPLILRSMVDTYITFAWIFLEPVERARQFILHGLGQEKLIIEHHRVHLSSTGQNPDDSPMIQVMEGWLNAQRFAFLTEVNVGSWSGTDTRKMAEEADCADLYRFAYTPFSAATHGMWNHVAKYNLTTCQNVLHRHHRIPAESSGDPDVDYLYQAAKYVEKTFQEFDLRVGIPVNGESALKVLTAGLERLAERAARASEPED